MKKPIYNRINIISWVCLQIYITTRGFDDRERGCLMFIFALGSASSSFAFVYFTDVSILFCLVPFLFYGVIVFLDQVFVFDGSTGVTVPAEVMSHNLTQNFTIAVWLKHEHHAGQDKHVKEHILCNADDHRNS